MQYVKAGPDIKRIWYRTAKIFVNTWIRIENARVLVRINSSFQPGPLVPVCVACLCDIQQRRPRDPFVGTPPGNTNNNYKHRTTTYSIYIYIYIRLLLLFRTRGRTSKSCVVRAMYTTRVFTFTPFISYQLFHNLPINFNRKILNNWSVMM